MKQRRLIHWKSIEDCKEYFKGVGYSGEVLNDRVRQSIKYGNYLSVDRIKGIKERFNINVIGGE